MSATTATGKRPNARGPALRVVDNDCDGAPEPGQLVAPLLQVAPKPEPARDLELPPVLPLADGVGGAVWFQTRAVSPEERRELQAALLPVRRRRHETTIKTPEQRRAGAEALLRRFATRSGPPGLTIAGRLLVEHGERARGALHATWCPTWGATLKRLDALLDAVGVPPAGPLL